MAGLDAEEEDHPPGGGRGRRAPAGGQQEPQREDGRWTQGSGGVASRPSTQGTSVVDTVGGVVFHPVGRPADARRPWSSLDRRPRLAVGSRTGWVAETWPARCRGCAWGGCWQGRVSTGPGRAPNGFCLVLRAGMHTPGTGESDPVKGGVLPALGRTWGAGGWVGRKDAGTACPMARGAAVTPDGFGWAEACVGARGQGPLLPVLSSDRGL